jgi:hypothetical protein
MLPEVDCVPMNPETARVAITILRITWFPRSATRAYAPSGEIHTPYGELKLALVPIPFDDDTDVLPAKGETWSEVRSNRRIRVLLSVKRAKLPEGAMVMLVGDFKYAFVPTPSVVPATPARPARVVTTPVEMMICRSK